MAKNRTSKRAENLKLGGFVLALFGFGTAFGGMPGNPVWFTVLTIALMTAGVLTCAYGFVLKSRVRRAGSPEDGDGHA